MRKSSKDLKVGQNHAMENSLFENLITFDELLSLLKHQYSRHTVYRWVQRKGMPHKRIMGKLWFPVPHVFEWLERS